MAFTNMVESNTLVPITLEHVNAVTIRRIVDPDTGATIGVEEDLHYTLYDDAGNVVRAGTFNIEAAPAVVTALTAHINTDLLPAANTAIGFVEV